MFWFFPSNSRSMDLVIACISHPNYHCRLHVWRMICKGVNPKKLSSLTSSVINSTVTIDFKTLDNTFGYQVNIIRTISDFTYFHFSAYFHQPPQRKILIHLNCEYSFFIILTRSFLKSIK